MAEVNRIPKADFLEETYGILEEAKERNIVLRLIGALAFRIHCPKFAKIQELRMVSVGKVFTDIDLIAYKNQKKEIERLLLDLGYMSDSTFNVLYGRKRLLFHDNSNKRHSDIFFDRLEMNHIIDFTGRLEIDYPTIPLVDLLLEKMQIVRINEKDIVDSIMLIREHNVGDDDKETINVKYLAKLCGGDWGLWKTITMNLRKVLGFLATCEDISVEDKSDVNAKINRILEEIEKQPKTLGWKMRARVGENRKWYMDVEEIYK